MSKEALQEEVAKVDGALRTGVRFRDLTIRQQQVVRAAQQRGIPTLHEN